MPAEISPCGSGFNKMTHSGTPAESARSLRQKSERNRRQVAFLSTYQNL